MHTRDELTPLGHKLASPAREQLASTANVPNNFGWDDDSDTQVVTPDMLAPGWDEDARTEPSVDPRWQPAAASGAPRQRTAAGSGVRESVARQLANQPARSGAASTAGRGAVGTTPRAPGMTPGRAAVAVEEEDPVDELRERLIGTLERARKAEQRAAVAERRAQAAEQRGQQIEQAHEQQGVLARAQLEELRGRLTAHQDRARATEARVREVDRRAEDAELRARAAEQRAYETEQRAAEAEQESSDALRQMAEQLAAAHEQNEIREGQLFESDARRERAARDAREARAALQHSEASANHARKNAALRARAGLFGLFLVAAALGAGSYFLVYLPGQQQLANLEASERFASEQHARELASLRTTHDQQERALTAARIELERQLVEARAAAATPPPAARERDVPEAEALPPVATPRRPRQARAEEAEAAKPAAEATPAPAAPSVDSDDPLEGL